MLLPLSIPMFAQSGSAIRVVALLLILLPVFTAECCWRGQGTCSDACSAAGCACKNWCCAANTNQCNKGRRLAGKKKKKGECAGKGDWTVHKSACLDLTTESSCQERSCQWSTCENKCKPPCCLNTKYPEHCPGKQSNMNHCIMQNDTCVQREECKMNDHFAHVRQDACAPGALAASGAFKSAIRVWLISGLGSIMSYVCSGPSNIFEKA